jgi:hypothetical protein
MKNRFAVAHSCIANGWKRTLAVCLLLCALGPALSAKAQDRKGTIITFDVPGAGTTSSASASCQGGLNIKSKNYCFLMRNSLGRLRSLVVSFASVEHYMSASKPSRAPRRLTLWT